MRKNQALVLAALVGAIITAPSHIRAGDPVTEEAIEAPNGVKVKVVKVRMEGPYTADVQLQVICYFKYTPDGAKRISGAPVELDRRLGGVIASLRERGDFVGEALETLLIVPPEGSIKAKLLLLIGLGDESTLSLARLEWVGKTALREAVRVNAKTVGFAPLIRDQGNSKFSAADAAGAVFRGAFFAYDTEKRLQKEGFAKPYSIEQWVQEAGQMYFEETVAAGTQVAKDVLSAIATKHAAPYAQPKK